MAGGFEVAALEDIGDERGSGWQPAGFLDRLSSIEDVHVMTLRPGHVRGNHFHRIRNEVLFVEHAGEWRLIWGEEDGGEAHEKMFDGAGAAAAFIPSGYPHAVENLGSADLRVIGFSDIPYDPEAPDTYPWASQGA